MTRKDALLVSKNRTMIDGFVRVLHENGKHKKANELVRKQIKAEKVLYVLLKELGEVWRRV